jgi:hypothetical protein
LKRRVKTTVTQMNQHLQQCPLHIGKTFRSPYSPNCHQFKGTSNSSVRVDIAKHVSINMQHHTTAGKISSRTTSYRDLKSKRLQKFDHVLLSDVENYDSTKKVFYVTDTSDAFFEAKKSTINMISAIHFKHISSLHVIDTNNGCCHNYNMQSSFTFVKLPRKWALQKATNVENDYATLLRLLKGKKLSRGFSHLDISQSYRTFGSYCPQNSRGISKKEDAQSCKISTNDNTQLRYIYNRVTQLALRVLPTGLIRGIRASQKLLPWDTIGGNIQSSDTPNNSPTSFWAAAAASCNYISASHVDDDFFYSGLLVICHDDQDVTEKNGNCTHYRPNLPPAVCFCFPRKGTAIALRPGDFILFNPTEPHCVSMREKFYENKQVILMSFYLKSSIVGGNNNLLTNDHLLSNESLTSFYQTVQN